MALTEYAENVKKTAGTSQTFAVIISLCAHRYLIFGRK